MRRTVIVHTDQEYVERCFRHDGSFYDNKYIGVPEMFCPHCGKQTVYMEDGFLFDEERGREHLCTSCDGYFYL